MTKVQNDQYGLAKEVRVKTGADLTDLSHVYVAKRDPKTIPDDESRVNNAYTVLFFDRYFTILYRYRNWASYTNAHR